MRIDHKNYNTAHDPELYALEVPEGVDLLSSATSSGRRGGTVFIARYVSECVACLSPIKPGDEAHYGLDNQVEHADCPDPLEAPAQGVCEGCWLTLPVSGLCGVCE